MLFAPKPGPVPAGRRVSRALKYALRHCGLEAVSVEETDVDACKTCKRPIRWAKSVHGRLLPLDPEPVAGGNLVLDDQGVARVLRPEVPYGGPRYTSHFVTCPQAREHRRLS